MKFLGCLLMMLVTQTLSDQKILSLPGGQTGPAPCARTCSGVSSYKETGAYKWITVGNGKAYKRADIRECGFVSAPVVTAILRGLGYTQFCPSIRVMYVSDTWLVFFTVEDATASNMIRYNCDVFWIATGYVC